LIDRILELSGFELGDIQRPVMRRIKIILGLAVLVPTIMAEWQIGAWELANINLQEDMRDLASQAGAHIGVVVPMTDEDLSRAIVRKAWDHGIELKPTQVTVRRTNTGETSNLYLASDYTVPVNLAVVSFRLHFTPTSDKKGIV
jgi:hypothetical protein